MRRHQRCDGTVVAHEDIDRNIGNGSMLAFQVKYV